MTRGPREAVLITGAAGFVGATLAHRLQSSGREVVGFDVAPAPRGMKLPWVEADLRDAARVEAAIETYRIGRIAHAGAISGPMVLPDDPRTVFEINVLGTLNVLESARRLGVARVVLLSSFITYGDQPDDGIVTEDRTLRAADAYAGSKIAAEAAVRAYRDRHGVDAVSLRLGAVYGPGRTTDCLVRTFLENALAGKATTLGYGAGHHRSYVYVDDVAAAAAAALDVPAERLTITAYNVDGGVWPSLDEVARVAAELVPGLETTLAPGRIPLACRIGPLDLSAARRDLGYRPRVSLRDGIGRYHAWLAGGGSGMEPGTRVSPRNRALSAFGRGADGC